MNLLNVETGERLNAKIEQLGKAELSQVKNNKEFSFDWSLESQNQVFGLRELAQKELIGLISISDVVEELRVHINLIESAKRNRGKNKDIEGIPGCLIGFVCQLAFSKGYDGFVSLFPKTMLIDYYHKKFGFVHMGTNMVVFLELAQSIIKNYLKDE